MENVGIDTRLAHVYKILYNIYTNLDNYSWLVPAGIPVNSDNVAVFLTVQLERIEILYSCLEEMFLRINSKIIWIL